MWNYPRLEIRPRIRAFAEIQGGQIHSRAKLARRRAVVSSLRARAPPSSQIDPILRRLRSVCVYVTSHHLGSLSPRITTTAHNHRRILSKFLEQKECWYNRSSIRQSSSPLSHHPANMQHHWRVHSPRDLLPTFPQLAIEIIHIASSLYLLCTGAKPSISRFLH